MNWTVREEILYVLCTCIHASVLNEQYGNEESKTTLFFWKTVWWNDCLVCLLSPFVCWLCPDVLSLWCQVFALSPQVMALSLPDRCLTESCAASSCGTQVWWRRFASVGQATPSAITLTPLWTATASWWMASGPPTRRTAGRLQHGSAKRCSRVLTTRWGKPKSSSRLEWSTWTFGCSSVLFLSQICLLLFVHDLQRRSVFSEDKCIWSAMSSRFHICSQQQNGSKQTSYNLNKLKLARDWKCDSQSQTCPVPWVSHVPFSQGQPCSSPLSQPCPIFPRLTLFHSPESAMSHFPKVNLVPVPWVSHVPFSHG